MVPNLFVKCQKAFAICVPIVAQIVVPYKLNRKETTSNNNHILMGVQKKITIKKNVCMITIAFWYFQAMDPDDRISKNPWVAGWSLSTN